MLVATCICPGEDVTVCRISSLAFEGTVCQVPGAVGAIAGIGIAVDGCGWGYPGPTFHDPPENDCVSFSDPLSLTLAEPNNWGRIAFFMETDASLFQVPPEGSQPQNVSGGASIRIQYDCDNPVTGHTEIKNKYAAPVSGGENECRTGTRVRSKVATAPHRWTDLDGDENGSWGGGALQYMSTPLGACNGSLDCQGGVTPFPKPVYYDYNTSNPNNFCICVEGGEAPYLFTIYEGSLPPGMGLNPATGCIQGTAEGPGGTPDFTVLVTDNVGDTTTVTCEFFVSRCLSSELQVAPNRFI